MQKIITRKTVAFILLLLFAVQLMGCRKAESPDTNQPSTPNAGASAWYENMKIVRTTTWAASVVETDTHFYYLAEDGVYAYAKDTGKTSAIIPEVAYGLFLVENNLYYNTEDEVKCINLQTKDTSALWDKSMLPDDQEQDIYYNAICDFALQDGYLYIAGTGISFIRVNLENHATEQFLEDCSEMVLLGDDCYYLDHAERTFSLYHMPCDSKESTLLRGEGTTEPEGMLIDGIAHIGDSVAYSVRKASDIYLYNPDGDDEKIFDGDDSDQLWVFFVKQCSAEKLYFYTTDGSQLKLYEYHPETGVSLLMSSEYAAHMCDIVITESAVF